MEHSDKKNILDSCLPAIFDSSARMTVLFDSSFDIADCNSATVEFLGFDSKEELIDGFMQRISEGLPEFQPDGRPSLTLPARLVTASQVGQEKFLTELFVDGVPKLLDIEIKHAQSGAPYYRKLKPFA